MNLLMFFPKLALGIMLALTSYLFVIFILKTNIQDFHNHDASQIILILSFIFLTTILFTVKILDKDRTFYVVAQGLLAIFLMSMIAIADTLSGRIPAIFLFLSMVFGLYLGVIGEKLSHHLLGGLITLLFGMISHYAGHLYYRQRAHLKHNKMNGFGLGDAYASGALGFLLGFPYGMYGFMMTLVIALGISLIQSAVKRQPYLRLRLHLGGYFYTAILIILLICL